MIEAGNRLNGVSAAVSAVTIPLLTMDLACDELSTIELDCSVSSWVSAPVMAALGLPFMLASCVDVNGAVDGGLNSSEYTAIPFTILKLEMLPLKNNPAVSFCAEAPNTNRATV